MTSPGHGRAWPSWLAMALLGAAATLPAPITWREAAAASAAALVGLALRDGAASRLCLAFGLALLGGTSVAQGGTVVRALALGSAIAAVIWMLLRRRAAGLSWPPHLTLAVGLGGLLAVALPVATSHLAGAPIDRAPGLPLFPAVVTTFAALLLFFSAERHRPLPRLVLALVLAIPGALGLVRLGQARVALAQAVRTHAPQELARAMQLSQRAGWARGEREAAVRAAHELLRLDRPAEAIELLPAHVVQDASSHLLRAEALRRSGRGAEAMTGFGKALALDGAVVPPFTGEGVAWLGLWSSRRGVRERAREQLASGLESVDADRFAAELALLEPDSSRALALLNRALERSPSSRFALCARATLAPTEAHARACLDEVPMHAPSLRVLAEAGDETAGRLLARAADLPALNTEFEGLLALRGARVEKTRATPGDIVTVELAFEVLRTPSPSEQYVVSVHFDGPTFFGGNHLPPVERHSETWVAGEQFRYSTDFRVPAHAVAGSYPVHLSIYSPASRVRLQPSNMPGHLRIIRIATLEIGP